MITATVKGTPPRLVVDNNAGTATIYRGNQFVEIVSPEREEIIIPGILDFSNPMNSGLLALLEDI